MVKNTQGGNKHKKFARKANDAAAKNNRLRISEDAGEIYAVVTKLLGNGMFHCHCLDNIVRLGHIRGKFSGKGKRDNFVEGGKWVLIGLREWDISKEENAKKTTTTMVKEKIQQCDLLEVYTDTDKLRLRDTIFHNWSVLDINDITKDKDKSKSTDANDDVVIFTTDNVLEREQLIKEMKSATAEKIVLHLGEKEEEEEINIDDI